LVFLLQLTSGQKCIVHNGLRGEYRDRGFQDSLLNDSYGVPPRNEATHASAPKIEKIHATAPVAAEVPAVVVPFPRPASTEFKCEVTARLQETEDIISLWLKPKGRTMPQLAWHAYQRDYPAGCTAILRGQQSK
jgi:hypothetical protein